jgi:hypothetical protein
MGARAQTGFAASEAEARKGCELETAEEFFGRYFITISACQVLIDL